MYATAPADLLHDLTDAELVRRFRRGDDGALEVLLGRHRDALYRFCCHLVSNREDAEDICQESLTRAMANVDSLETGSAFRSWLFRIARNLSVDSFRSQRRICPLPDEGAVPEPLHVEGPQDRIETGEEYRTVVQALTRLTKSHQRVLMLREIEGLSYAEIARRLDVSQSAVETLLFRARRRLREEYGKEEGGKVAGLPGVALVAGIRELLLRLGEPLAGTPPVAGKMAVTAAVAGAALVSAPHVFHPSHRASIHRIHRSLAVSHHTAYHARAARPILAFVNPPRTAAPAPHAQSMAGRPSPVLHRRRMLKETHPATVAPRLVSVRLAHASVRRPQTKRIGLHRFLRNRHLHSRASKLARASVASAVLSAARRIAARVHRSRVTTGAQMPSHVSTRGMPSRRSVTWSATSPSARSGLPAQIAGSPAYPSGSSPGTGQAAAADTSRAYSQSAPGVSAASPHTTIYAPPGAVIAPGQQAPASASSGAAANQQYLVRSEGASSTASPPGLPLPGRGNRP